MLDEEGILILCEWCGNPAVKEVGLYCYCEECSYRAQREWDKEVKECAMEDLRE